jgi:GGDEF domain-containing protein
MASPGPRRRGEVVIIDERPHGLNPSRDNPSRVFVAREPSTAEQAQSAGEAQPPRYPPPTAPTEIEIRDERVEQGPAAWIRSIGRELERFAAEARPFAVLLIELMDVERLSRTELPEEVLRLAARVERTLELELRTISERRAGSLTREAPGRFWLLAPGVGVLRAGALADQVAHAVRGSVSHRGQPLEIAVGVAVAPDDGLQAPALAAHADVALYAARAGGSAGYGPAR